MKTLYLMRHGQTLFNKLEKTQGACDSPLTVEGIEDAKATRQFFEEHQMHFDYCFSSTQERASDTLELVTDQPYQRLKGVKEWNFGIFEGESETLLPKTYYTDGSYGDFFVEFGGESATEFQARVIKTLKETMAQVSDDENALVVCHGAVMLMFMQSLFPMGKIAREISFHNCAVLKLTFDDDKFEFVEQVK
ncbi:histidine phosphatase family protein [Companilactobacillus kimchii]|uniref:Phosphoglycerate mutase n=2 Tax=Companilactobacillus kimchii TaxID=2801452 RepID=A0ABR5NRW6_9LACO|nr:histidine phosphatase family protein [Companilactobacillus kimchii]KAE9559359.1 phosphoglycerate mutase [Companilactobacillus kimchii]KRK50754.1 phosphoglycerate mutase [Companilactobacillus kimchii DSM 13961 = JCM 10707]OWF32512.1 Phosphoglycerate mutase (2,3-diphosphoglycerate-independent) [Companilactobacillus kimchii]GEO47488.1 phosphoglycerate mutase [Companilactobacillus paralimentarius]